MVKFLPRVILLALMFMGGLFGLNWYENNSTDHKLREKDKIIEAERARNEVLRGIVKRLQTDRRLARIIVADQQTKDGRTETRIAFSEYDREGKTLLEGTTRDFTVLGTTVYVAAYVVEFDDALVEKSDPGKGHGIALFQRLFGQPGLYNESTAPFELRSASEPPGGAHSELEKQVWQDFWKLENDEALRKKYNVRRAGGKAVFSEQFKPGFVYTLTLDPRGNLGMTVEPMDPLIEKVMREQRESRDRGAATRPAK